MSCELNLHDYRVAEIKKDGEEWAYIVCLKCGDIIKRKPEIRDK